MPATSKISKPDWLRIRPPGGENYTSIKGLLRSLGLHTVCEEASCPNVSECWGGGTATIMLLGDTCTRGCRFCNVKTGKPNGVVDELEPYKVGSAISKLGLTYIVLTSVDRDDLPDGGADHFARTVEQIKKGDSKILVEILIPDFKADADCLSRVIQSGAEVIAHNMETVRRLTPKVRDPRCGYDQSLQVLKYIKQRSPSTFTKTSIMLGVGETEQEVCQTMDELRAIGVDIVTFGQYLRPSKKHLPVECYVTPEQFKKYEEIGLEKGFAFVPSGPLVRSSYRAGEKFIEALVLGKQVVQKSPSDLDRK